MINPLMQKSYESGGRGQGAKVESFDGDSDSDSMPDLDDQDDMPGLEDPDDMPGLEDVDGKVDDGDESDGSLPELVDDMNLQESVRVEEVD